MHVQTIDYSDVNIGPKLVQSLHETGFAVLKEHPISDPVLTSLYTDWHNFFRSQDKYKFQVDPLQTLGSQEGYYPREEAETAVGYSTRDLKEYFHVTWDGTIPQTVLETTLAYRHLVLNLSSQLLAWIEASTPLGTLKNLSEPLSGIISPQASLLRILHYPPLRGTESVNAIRAAPHEDINLITVLPASNQPGLQVRDNQGQWISVSTNTRELIINTGDMLLEASNGYFPSTTHQVVNPDDEIPNSSRISAPFFLTPRLDLKLSSKYTAGSYLQERLRQITR